MRLASSAVSAAVVALAFFALAPAASAYEYPLQFTPNSGARGLVVAGYAFTPTGESGNCSYYTQHSGSGRGGGYKTVKTYYNQTCNWDKYGNLLSVTAGAPTVPVPLTTRGTETIYATAPGSAYTGVDTAGGAHGFIFTYGAHYTWTTPGTYLVLPQAPHQITASIVSDGDYAVTIAKVTASALLGKVTVLSNGCTGKIAVGTSCSIIVNYDPTAITVTSDVANPLVYDTLRIGLIASAGVATDFVQSYTVHINPANNNN